MIDWDGNFLEHFIKEKLPEDSSRFLAQALALQVFEWCTEYGLSDTLEFIAGDSNNYYMGYEGDPFPYLEVYQDRMLFWIMCQLHTGVYIVPQNEHLFHHVEISFQIFTHKTHQKFVKFTWKTPEKAIFVKKRNYNIKAKKEFYTSWEKI